MSLPLLAVYSAAGICLGALLLRLVLGGRTPSETLGPTAGICSALLLGQGVLANVWLLIGLAGWFKTWVIAPVLMACVLTGWKYARPMIAGFGGALGAQWRALRADWWAWRLLGYLLIVQIAMMGVGAVFAPPRGDAAAFYMTLPKYMAWCDRLVALPTYREFSQVGLQGEMHFAALMSLGSQSAAKGFVWPTSLAGLGMLLAIGGMTGLRRRGKWIAVAMYFTATAVTKISVDGKVDLFGAAMGIAAIYWALRATDRSWRAVCLCGLFTGLAAVAKLSYVGALVPGVFALLLWRCFYRPDNRIRPGSEIPPALSVVLVWGVCALAAVVPHLIKNGVLFGQPLAPFVGVTNQWVQQDWYAGEDHIVRWIHVTYPLALFFGDYKMQGGTLSPLMLAFFPLVVLSWRRSRPLRSGLLQVSAAAVFGLVVFAILRPRVFAPRYVLAPLLILILPAAVGAQIALDSRRRGEILSVVIAAALLLVTAGRVGQDISQVGEDAVKYTWGRFVDPRRLPPDAASAELLNARADIGEKVVLATYYCYWVRSDLIRNHIVPTQSESFVRLKTSEQRWRWLYDEGIRYILLDTRGDFGSEAADGIIVYPDSGGLLSTASVPDGLEVEVLYRRKGKGRITLHLKAPSAESRP